nr:unnamed protein product [Naegleria fowleri]
MIPQQHLASTLSSYNGTSSSGFATPMMTMTQRIQNGRGHMPSGRNTSNGGAGGGVGNTSSSSSVSSSSYHQHHDHFAREVLQRVIADACRYHGFHAIKSSASDFLIDLLQSLIQNIAVTSVEYSTHCGRTEVNVFDVERALKHRMNIGVNDLLSFMNVLQDKSQDDTVDLATFEFDIPDIPKPTSSSLMSCPQTHFHLLYKNKGKTIMFDEEEEEEHERQIQLIEQQKPKFLPSLPPKHTFRFTPIMNKRTRDQYKIQLEKTRQRRHIEESLTRLHEAELIQMHDYLEQQQKELQNIIDHTLIPHDQTALIKTKKKTIVQKNDVLLHLDKKPAALLSGQRRKKPEDEQAMPNQGDEEKGELEDITQDETATTVVNPYLQIEKQRVSLAVQRNVTQSTTNPVNVSRLTTILSTPKKSHTTKKPFISIITRDDSAEVLATKSLKSGAIANQLASNDDDLDISSEVIPTKQKKSLGVIEPSSIRISTSSNDSSLMPPPSNPISQFAPSQSLNLSSSANNPVSSAATTGNSFPLSSSSSSFGTIEPISQPLPPTSTSAPMSGMANSSFSLSGSTNNVTSSVGGDDDEFEEVEAGEEPTSKKFKL